MLNSHIVLVMAELFRADMMNSLHPPNTQPPTENHGLVGDETTYWEL